MEGDTSNTNEDVQLNADVIDDNFDENLPSANSPSSFMQQDDDNIKTSVPVADETEAVVSQGNLTVKRILGAMECTASSSLNLVDQNTTTISSSSIVEINSIITSTDVQPCMAPIINDPKSQMNATTAGNCQQQLQERKHIMISYNRATASTICQKIYDRLKERNYNVWFDRKSFTYGRVNAVLGKAIDNSYVVLLCMTEGYSKSEYCLGEAVYAKERKIPVIPCMMEHFDPCGILGFIRSDFKRFSFIDEDKFDENFEELVIAINAIEAELDMRFTSISDMNFRDRFNAIITDHIVSIENSHLHRENLDDSELGTVLRTLIQEFSPGTLRSLENDQSNGVVHRQINEGENDHLLQRLLENDKRLAELAQIQQENYDRIQQHLLNQDERLAAFIRFQQGQEQENRHLNHNDYLMSLLRVQDVQQQGQERNDRISQQLLQHIEQLTELVVQQQQQQHSRDTESLQQLIHRSLEPIESSRRADDQADTAPDTPQQQRFQFDFIMFKDLIQTIVLLWTLLVLLKDK